MLKIRNVARIFAVILSILIATGCSVSLAEKNYVQGITQHTQYGQVMGTTDEATGNLVWRGVKFAKAPCGGLSLESTSAAGLLERSQRDSDGRSKMYADQRIFRNGFW